tara:strand:+ start:4460 stop:4756 length:297 start_codon:yes stop_codon:yes gene_type:complete
MLPAFDGSDLTLNVLNEELVAVALGHFKHFVQAIKLSLLLVVQHHQPPLQYLILSGESGGSQPLRGVSRHSMKGMVWISMQMAITISAKPVPGEWTLA